MLIELKNVSYSYDLTQNPPKYSVDDVSLTIDEGEFVAIVGHTGSGKSTLIQMFDGLFMPSKGEVLYEGRNIQEKGFSLKELRSNVGLVFQYPEHQLFESTVLEDVKFGPKNLKLPKEEQEARAKEALALVGFAEDDYDKSPFDLSGGQKRRVAIAGILAMKPKCLVLDEPTAGLDPEGREDLFRLLTTLNERDGMTIVLVSHSMEDVARYAKRIIVMNHGEKLMDGVPREVFAEKERLAAIGLSVPDSMRIMGVLREKGLNVRTDCLTIEEARDEILRALGR